MKEIKETYFIADDGKRFEKKEECEHYEFETHRDFKKMIGDMNYIYTTAENIYPMGDYCNGVLFVEIQNKEQADRFLKWLNAKSEYFHEIEADSIVGDVLICDCYDEGTDSIDTVYECVTPHDMINNFAKHVLNYVSKVRRNGAYEKENKNS